MGKKASYSGGKKKKGPKGKKARAKAKLERQWGEELTEEQIEQAKRNRRGTSTKLKDSKTTAHAESRTSKKLPDSQLPKPSLLGTRQEHDGDSDEDMDEQEHTGNALNVLLQSIQKRKKAFDVDSSEDGPLESKKSTQPSMFHDPTEDSNDESEEDDEAVVDLFGRHFNRPPLPEPGNEDSSADTMVKVPLTAVDESIEMHASSRLITAFKSFIESPANTKDGVASVDATELNWQKLTKKSLRGVRKALVRTWPTPEAQDEKAKLLRRMTPLQRVLFPCLARYSDILMTAESMDNREEVSSLLRLHVLNHVLTSRSRIQRHNQRLKELAKMEDEKALLAAQGKFRDQGYTRPTVLVLMPTRGTCYAFVKGMMQLLGGGNASSNAKKKIVDNNWDRFEAEFGAPPSATTSDDDTAAERRRKMVLQKKGLEWLELFGDDVNDDDDFKIGISLTPKAPTTARASSSTKQQHHDSSDGQPQHHDHYNQDYDDNYTNVSMRLFTDFYKSDIIVASPLALKLLSATTTDNDHNSNDDDATDYDFLSSIEICILARTDVLLMQNMDHVTSVLSLLNQQPRKNHHAEIPIDFSRVREYYLAGQANQWRQVILCSNITDPQILSIFKRHASSWQGSVKLKRIVTSDDCAIGQVLLPIPQVFQRVHCTSLSEQGDTKLKYFVDKILPAIRKQKHTMIFIPSYFEFISLRNMLLKREDVEFVSVTEYSRISEVSRSRARFLQGRKPLLLYTGRAHYFHRHVIKGVRHLIFFGLPEQAKFYVDLIHTVGEGLSRSQQHDHDDQVDKEATNGDPTCLALFTKYDAHSLERIAGREDCRKMLKSEKTAHAFMSS